MTRLGESIVELVSIESSVVSRSLTYKLCSQWNGIDSRNSWSKNRVQKLYFKLVR